MIREVDTSLSEITSAMSERQKKYEKGAEKLAGVSMRRDVFRKQTDSIAQVVTAGEQVCCGQWSQDHISVLL